MHVSVGLSPNKKESGLPHEKEALAVIWSLAREKFRTYLYAASVAGSGRYISRVGRASRFLSLLRILRKIMHS